MNRTTVDRRSPGRAFERIDFELRRLSKRLLEARAAGNDGDAASTMLTIDSLLDGRLVLMGKRR
jgi:hypothetical protein